MPTSSRPPHPMKPTRRGRRPRRPAPPHPMNAPRRGDPRGRPPHRIIILSVGADAPVRPNPRNPWKHTASPGPRRPRSAPRCPTLTSIHAAQKLLLIVTAPAARRISQKIGARSAPIFYTLSYSTYWNLIPFSSSTSLAETARHRGSFSKFGKKASAGASAKILVT